MPATSKFSNTSDVAIIGGGVIGCSIAYNLAKIGIKSTLFEKGSLASGASGATAGIIGPLWYIDHTFDQYFKFGLASLKNFPQLAAELGEAGIDPEFRQNGIIKLALNEYIYEELQQNLMWQKKLGLNIHWLDRKQVLELEPDVNPEVLGGVFSSEEGCIRGESYVRSLAQAAQNLGATILEREEVIGLINEGTKITGLQTTKGTYSAEMTVIAAGAWTGIPEKWGTKTIPVRPVKGQRILVRKAGLIPKSTVQNVVPEVNGNILIGATREEGVFDQQITIKGIREMAEAAITIFPKLWDAEFVSARAGIRPGSPDGKPILGPITELDGLSVATGHDWAGIMLSPETGRLMAEYISTGDPKPLQPFNPNRFDNKIVEAIARPLFWNIKQDYQS